MLPAGPPSRRSLPEPPSRLSAMKRPGDPAASPPPMPISVSLPEPPVRFSTSPPRSRSQPPSGAGVVLLALVLAGPCGPAGQLTGLGVGGAERAVLHLRAGDGVLAELNRSGGVLRDDHVHGRVAERRRPENGDGERGGGEDRGSFRSEHCGPPASRHLFLSPERLGRRALRAPWGRLPDRVSESRRLRGGRPVARSRRAE